MSQAKRRKLFWPDRKISHLAVASETSGKNSEMFSVNFDRASIKISDKVWNLTISLVKKVLENAGLDEGDWFLRVPHRIRKKGHERFKALRMDFGGGAKGIRIRCKPQGNDTSFEYTLVPPADKDIENLFNLLSRVHPKNLDIHETILLKTMIEEPEARELMKVARNVLLPLPKEPKTIHSLHEPTIVNCEPLADAEKGGQNQNGNGDSLTEAGAGDEADADDAIIGAWQEYVEETSATKEELSNITNPAPASSEIEKIQTLALSESTMLSDQEALDRALVALSFVVDRGYAKKALASTAIIENLDIKNFVKNISDTYISVEGAMRSLTMALRKNNYIERVLYGAGESVRGYKLTHKGEKRIIALKKFLSEKIISQMNKSWSRFEPTNTDSGSFESVYEESALPEEKEEPPMQVQYEENSKETAESYEKLESLVASLKVANEQIVEANGFIENLNSEKADLSIELLGLDKAVEDQIRLKDEIEKRISKLRDKKEEIDKKIKQKDAEIAEWQSYQVPYEQEKNKLKKEIEKLAESVGIGFGS